MDYELAQLASFSESAVQRTNADLNAQLVANGTLQMAHSSFSRFFGLFRLMRISPNRLPLFPPQAESMHRLALVQRESQELCESLQRNQTALADTRLQLKVVSVFISLTSYSDCHS